MNKIVGYLIALIGLIIIALSILKKLPIPDSINPAYSFIAGIAIIIFGIALTLNKSSSHSKAKQESEEVPIYAGEGKKRRIVGYQRAK